MARIPSLWTEDKWVTDPMSFFSRDLRDLFRNPEAARWAVPETGRTLPPVNIAETKDALEIAVELPGVAETDVRVTLDHQRLTIAGEKKTERESTEKNWHVVERSSGAFQRVVALPFEPAADAVEARFDKGVLHVTVKKPTEVVQKSREIPVKPSA
ncbi:MAG: Hsp20/alpha crystallin family protein [Alsobacter sp.]